MFFLLAQYAYTHPFIQPLPVWDAWPWLLAPLCVAVSIVYKSIKCPSMRQVPREAAGIFLWIVGGMAAVGGALALIVKVLER